MNFISCAGNGVCMVFVHLAPGLLLYYLTSLMNPHHYSTDRIAIDKLNSHTDLKPYLRHTLTQWFSMSLV